MYFLFIYIFLFDYTHISIKTIATVYCIIIFLDVLLLSRFLLFFIGPLFLLVYCVLRFYIVLCCLLKVFSCFMFSHSILRYLILYHILYFFSSTIFTHYILGALPHVLIAENMPDVQVASSHVCGWSGSQSDTRTVGMQKQVLSLRVTAAMESLVRITTSSTMLRLLRCINYQ